MLVYSNKIIKFINEIKNTIKDVLSKEVGLRVHGDRFYDKLNEYSYPINVVVFNNKSTLGYFDSNFYELGFHELLMNSSKEKLCNIIRHELAHYITFINYKFPVQAHGPVFRALCCRLGWGEEVYLATTCVDSESIDELEENNVLRKVQKLIALSSSSNQYEAEQAMIKSRQLLLKHNIDSSYTKDEKGNADEKVYLKRILKQKRKNSKMYAIGKILQTFFVNIVYNSIKGSVFLEIVGNSVNIEIADYVANFLDKELESQWNQLKKQHKQLKGMVAKNSFFSGVAIGYCLKIDALKKEYTKDTTNALLVIEKKLVEACAMVYSRLGLIRSHRLYCHESSLLGERVGKELNINPGLNGYSKNSGTYIAYKS